MKDLDERMRLARAVTQEAADTARRRFRTLNGGQFKLKGPQDYLTEVDGEIEWRIRRRIARSFPRDAFFGEEGEERCVGTWTWVVDPIDGTANFARGIPEFAMSISPPPRRPPSSVGRRSRVKGARAAAPAPNVSRPPPAPVP